MKIKNLIFTLLCVTSIFSANAEILGEWKLHPSFDNSVTRVIDTPERCYFLGYNQTINANISFKSVPDLYLFYYDKEGDELVAAAQRYALSNNAVRMAEYNPQKGYLLVVYDDANIDFIYDSGDIRNVAALKNANIPGSKAVNFISFSPANDLAYLATDFGYLAINDKKFEVAESRNYGRSLSSIARVGNDLYISTDSAIQMAPASEPRLNFSEYTIVDEMFPSIGLYPLNDKRLLSIYQQEANYTHMHLLENTGSDHKTLNSARVWGNCSVAPAKEGYIAMTVGNSFYYKPTASYPASQARPEYDQNLQGGTWDQVEFWTAEPRKGLRSSKLNADKTFSLTRDNMMPNAPNAYFSRGMLYHPRYGMLVNSHGTDGIFDDNSLNEPILLSGYKNGLWTPLSPAYRYPEQKAVGANPVGLAIDPDNDKYVYMGSPFSGMTRLNLDDPNDILHYSFPGDPTASLPGYVETNGIIQSWARTCPFMQPGFDADGNLWAFFSSNDNTDCMEFRYLTAADRKASTNAANARPWKKLYVKGSKPGYTANFLPLKASVNKNIFLFVRQDGIIVYDHKGTLDNTSDDTYRILTGFTDQDGGTIDLYRPSAIWEDTDSGIVWIGNNSGLFYCQPKNLLQGQAIINRVKVARNDGTSLADYLLSGVRVSTITTDGAGRKWFGALGAGIVVTSADGRTVLGEFTTANSGLPSNDVYSMCYNPDSRSMMVSTAKGIAEFFMAGSAETDADAEQVRAYPNPVTPDYYGWVTIDGLPDNSLVKVVDAQGNLVRELGRAEAGTAQWDVNNLYNKRVNTGVYYILCSSASNGGKENNVAKILIMN